MKKQNLPKIIIALLLIFAAVSANAQKKDVPRIEPLDPRLQIKQIVPSFNIEVGYGGQLPAELLAQRFGFSNYLCGGFHYYTPKMWFFGIDGGYFFGNDLREDPLLPYKTLDGRLLGKDREYSLIVQDERGFMVGALAGKIFPVSKKYPQTGIRATLTVGYLQHFIQQRDFAGQTPLLQDPYLIGFDRKTAGLHTTEFIGFQFVDNKGFINFFGGFEFTQGYTKPLRAWDTDLQQPTNQNTRLDLLNGLRVGMTLAIKQPKNSEIFY